MSRALYRSVVLLHPPAFRRRFGDEMLWVFEEASAGRCPIALVADGLASAVRQWLSSPVTMVVAGAIIGGLVPVVAGLAWTAFR